MEDGERPTPSLEQAKLHRERMIGRARAHGRERGVVTRLGRGPGGALDQPEIDDPEARRRADVPGVVAYIG